VGASGVVALLDQRHNEAVEEIWEELRREAGILRPQPDIPHYSYHVAESYDESAVEAALRKLAASSRPFRAWTTGLGVFTTPAPVVYVAVVRSLELSRYQRWAWWEIEPSARSSLDYYRPERWVPHITLAQQGLTADNLAAAIRLLANRELHWPIEVDNIAWVDGSSPEQPLRLRLPLGKEAPD
jgi:2'-5' RNA ligase